MGTKTSRQLKAAIKLGRYLMQSTTQVAGLTSTQLIECEELVTAYEVDGAVYIVGDMRLYGYYLIECIQPHSTIDNPGWTPDVAPALRKWHHTKNPAKAVAYKQPTADNDTYNTDECALWTDGLVYRCTVDATVHSPETLPTSWEVVT